MKQTKAFSLLELSLVILVIAILTLSVTQVYKLVENNRKVNLAVNQILTVYQAGANYEVVPSDPDLIKRFVDDGHLSEDFEKNNINPWGGKIIAYGISKDRNIIHIEMEPVSTAECSSIRMKFVNNANYYLGGCDVDNNANPPVSYLWMELAYNPIENTP